VSRERIVIEVLSQNPPPSLKRVIYYWILMWTRLTSVTLIYFLPLSN